MEIHNDLLILIIDKHVGRSEVVLCNYDAHAKINISKAVIKNTTITKRHVRTDLIKSPGSFDFGSPGHADVAAVVVCKIEIVNCRRVGPVRG